MKRSYAWMLLTLLMISVAVFACSDGDSSTGSWFSDDDDDDDNDDNDDNDDSTPDDDDDTTNDDDDDDTTDDDDDDDTTDDDDDDDDDDSVDCTCHDARMEDARYCQFAQRCQTAADCCSTGIPDGYTCNVDYPYLYACENQVCIRQNCSEDSQCQHYFDTQSLASNAVLVGCTASENACSGKEVRYCEIQTNCQTDADCCPEDIPDGTTCNEDYPYLYACEDNRCRSRSCRENGECAGMFEANYSSVPNYADGGCVHSGPASCEGSAYSYCLVGQICQTDTDCCPSPMPDGYTCNVDYPYRYRCDGGVCRQNPCESDSHCERYFEMISTSMGNVVNLGCQRPD